MSFSEGFIWGTATSSYQIEGNRSGDGKGLSIWDEFCKRPGAVLNGDTGDGACQHIVHFKEDVDIMKSLGIKAYRFSLSWPRILPLGKGKVNGQGLDFYKQLVDSLVERDIIPYVTLFHWDLPQVLHELGGWLHPDSPKWFEEYTAIAVSALKENVKHWMTFNEPNIFLPYGYATGIHAPGERKNHADLLRMHRNILLAHGRSVLKIKDLDSAAMVGMAPALTVPVPLSNSSSDIEAAKGYLLSTDEKLLGEDGHVWKKISWWTEPIFRGRYPSPWEQNGPLDLDKKEQLTSNDFELIQAPVDFLGLNIYTGYRVGMDSAGQAFTQRFPPGFPTTPMGWPVCPESLYWGTKILFDRYKCPIYITENGLSNPDWIHQGGNIPDANRIDFLKGYLQQLHLSIQDGTDVKGYFQWSFLDNFEWAYGYQQRFGLVHVDFSTYKRTPKESAHWYRQVVSTNGKNLEL